MVFAIDCSGSMDGKPIEQAKAAAERRPAPDGPADTFQVVEFSMNASHFGPRPVPRHAGKRPQGPRLWSVRSVVRAAQ